MLKILGFFAELWPDFAGTPAGRTADFVQTDAASDEAALTDYLRSGYELLSVMGVARDVLGSDERILGGDSLFTDGEWIWRGDLWFYLRKYHVRLPEEFIARVREQSYTVPELSLDRLAELSTEATKLF
jgi:hypothetical protein